MSLWRCGRACRARPDHFGWLPVAPWRLGISPGSRIVTGGVQAGALTLLLSSRLEPGTSLSCDAYYLIVRITKPFRANEPASKKARAHWKSFSEIVPVSCQNVVHRKWFREGPVNSEKSPQACTCRCWTNEFR